jgi:hypothetical protein
LPLPELRDEETKEVLRRERPCPRVELSEENRAVIPMARAILNESTRVLVPLVAEVLLPAVNRESRLLRILSAVQSKRVNDALAERIKRRAERRKPE